LLAVGCAALAAAGCTSSSGNASMALASDAQVAATQASHSSSSVLGTVTSAVVDPIAHAFDSTVAAVTSILPYENEASPAAHRRRMEEQAGTAHFHHEELSAGKDEMTRHREEFRAHKESFVSPVFAQSRTRWRSGDSRPNSGPVLGSAIATTLHDPDAARALLSGLAASTGVPVVTANPILAQLLPAFGN
jgi:hypothetical protein